MLNTASTISIDQSNFTSYSILNREGESSDRFENIDSVNVLIGPNNSGKSRLLRKLFSQKWKFLPEIDLAGMAEAIQDFNEKYNKLIAAQYVLGFRNQPDMVFNAKIEPENALETLQKIRTANQFVSHASNLQFSKWITKSGTTLTSTAGESALIDAIQNEYASLEEKIRRLSNDRTNLNSEMTSENLLHVYVPVLRGLRSPGDSSDPNDNPYLQRTMTDYNFTYDATKKEESYLLSDSHFVFTGLELYKDVTEMLLGDLSSRRRIVEYQNFLSENFFENQEIVLIPKPTEDVLTIKIGNEHEQPIYNCLLYTSPSPRDQRGSRMPSSA